MSLYDLQAMVVFGLVWFGDIVISDSKRFCETGSECDPKADCISNLYQCKEGYAGNGKNCSG